MKVLKSVRKEVVVAAGVALALLEPTATLLPAPYQAIAQGILPLLAVLATRPNTIPVSEVESLIAAIKSASAPK